MRPISTIHFIHAFFLCFLLSGFGNSRAFAQTLDGRGLEVKVEKVVTGKSVPSGQGSLASSSATIAFSGIPKLHYGEFVMLEMLALGGGGKPFSLKITDPKGDTLTLQCTISDSSTLSSSSSYKIYSYYTHLPQSMMRGNGTYGIDNIPVNASPSNTVADVQGITAYYVYRDSSRRFTEAKTTPAPAAQFILQVAGNYSTFQGAYLSDLDPRYIRNLRQWGSYFSLGSNSIAVAGYDLNLPTGSSTLPKTNFGLIAVASSPSDSAAKARRGLRLTASSGVGGGDLVFAFPHYYYYSISEELAPEVSVKTGGAGCSAASCSYTAEVSMSYSYGGIKAKWSDGKWGTNRNDLCAGTAYTVTVWDSTGIMAKKTFTISKNLKRLSIVPVSAAKPGGKGHARIKTYDLATPLQSVSYDGASADTALPTRSPLLSAGTHYIQIKDADGCVITDTFYIDEPVNIYDKTACGLQMRMFTAGAAIADNYKGGDFKLNSLPNCYEVDTAIAVFYLSRPPAAVSFYISGPNGADTIKPFKTVRSVDRLYTADTANALVVYYADVTPYINSKHGTYNLGYNSQSVITCDGSQLLLVYKDTSRKSNRILVNTAPRDRFPAGSLNIDSLHLGQDINLSCSSFDSSQYFMTTARMVANTRADTRVIISGNYEVPRYTSRPNYVVVNAGLSGSVTEYMGTLWQRWPYNYGYAGFYGMMLKDISCSTCYVPFAAAKQIITPQRCDTSANMNSVTLQPAGGYAPYTFQWLDNGDTARTRNNLTPFQQYKVVVTDALCRSRIDTVIISQFTGRPKVKATVTPVKCKGGKDGAAKIVLSGWPHTYSIKWHDPAGQTNFTATGLKTGYVGYTISSATGCGFPDSVLITEPKDSVRLTLISTDSVSCYGGRDGRAEVVATGGNGNFTITWNDMLGQTGTKASKLFAGTYKVKATDAKGCTATINVTIGQPSSLSAFISGYDSVSCRGGSDGTATVAVSGGHAPYTYSWSDAAAQKTAKATGLKAGNYSLMITDAKGCIASLSFKMPEPPQLQISIATVDSVKCTGDSSGAATVKTSGGSGAHTITWRGNGKLQTGLQLKHAPKGVYEATVTDAHGCTASVDVTIPEPQMLSLKMLSMDSVSCAGGSDGALTVTAAGGSGRYSYQWHTNPAQSGPKATGLAAGEYTVTVTDAHGCETSAKYQVKEPAPLSLTLVSRDSVDCSGAATGAAEIKAAGGAGAYTYLWDDEAAQATAAAVNLKAGKYAVTVTDANGCSATLSTQIYEPLPLSVKIKLRDSIRCHGMTNGMLEAVATGGSGAYRYEWNDISAQKKAEARGLGAGLYKVIATDAHGCTAEASFSLPEPDPLIVNLGAIDSVSCPGGNDGAATVTATGGSGHYQFRWSNGQKAARATGLPAGNHTVTVRDYRGCESTLTINVPEPEPLRAHIFLRENVKCHSGSDGALEAIATGGSGAYTYQWDDDSAQTNARAVGLKARVYTLTVTDAHGCKTTVFDTVKQPLPLRVKIIKSDSTVCAGSLDGGLTALATGGTGEYQYAWDDQHRQNGPRAIGLGAGSYTVKVRDGNGCETEAVGVVEEPLKLVIHIADSSDVLCHGSATGSARVSAMGGTRPYTYLWDDAAAQKTPKATGLRAGTYTVIVKDAKGCASRVSVTLREPDTLQVRYAIRPATCGKANGTISATARGGIPPYKYRWSQGSVIKDIFGLAPGTYTLELEDAAGCRYTEQVEIPAEPMMTVEGIAENHEITLGDTLLIRGMTNMPDRVRSVRWHPDVYMACPGCMITTVRPTATGDYTILVTDTNGCQFIARVPVKVIKKDLIVPTAFTPDEDPLNQQFYIRSPQITRITWRLYNRWGQELFYTDDQNKGWDGNFKGSPMPDGVYVWRASVELHGGEKKYMSGTVTLLRR